MNSKQNMVLWMGLGLILARLFTSGQWNALWSTVKNGGTSLTGLTTPAAPAAPARKARAKTGPVVVLCLSQLRLRISRQPFPPARKHR